MVDRVVAELQQNSSHFSALSIQIGFHGVEKHAHFSELETLNLFLIKNFYL